MDTLKDDLERAVPRVDPGPDRADELVGAGRRAVRRRRAAAVGALAGGGLVVASLAVGVSMPGDQREARDPAVATAPSGPQSSAATERGLRVQLSLDTLLRVHGECGRNSDPERTGQVRGDGWAAVEFACGADVVRVLQTSGGGLVERYEEDPPSTLEQWGRVRAEGGGR